MARVIPFPGTDLLLGPSPHLSWDEMDCNNGVVYPERWRRTRAVPLAREFELIRAEVGGPIGINSAFRTHAYNLASKGSRFSQHVEGRGLDLAVPSSLTMPEFLDIVLVVARRNGSLLKGIGVYPSFIHIDTRVLDRKGRPVTRIARWKGTRVEAEILRKFAA